MFTDLCSYLVRWLTEKFKLDPMHSRSFTKKIPKEYFLICGFHIINLGRWGKTMYEIGTARECHLHGTVNTTYNILTSLHNQTHSKVMEHQHITNILTMNLCILRSYPVLCLVLAIYWFINVNTDYHKLQEVCPLNINRFDNHVHTWIWTGYGLWLDYIWTV